MESLNSEILSAKEKLQLNLLKIAVLYTEHVFEESIEDLSQIDEHIRTLTFLMTTLQRAGITFPEEVTKSFPYPLR
ncbi:hypothetical protein [uncultured Phascolarctobacterium sp.]|uniref:hypothetical protein n=1 Tax=uncultured Phascolarctobacterium sp. TaxID=512296 RepID=UPI0025D18F60|nr:hypothetical protein [uncultured Phascolarctobacterium sp.]